MVTGMLIASGVNAGAQAYEGYQAYKSGKNQDRALKQQANFRTDQARLEREATKFDITKTSISFEKLMSRQRKSFAVSGVKINEGTPLTLLEESTRDKNETIKNIKSQGEARARSLEFEAEGLRRGGKQARRTGRNRLISGFIGGAGALLNAKNRASMIKRGENYG